MRRATTHHSRRSPRRLRRIRWRRRQFLPWDLAGAISWAVLCVTGGYLLGDNYQKLEDAIGKGGLVVGAVVVVLVFVMWERSKKQRERDAAENRNGYEPR